MCDELYEIGALMLREKQIGIFDDNYEGSEEERLHLKEMSNLECLYASHNFLKDVLGIS